MTLHATLLAAAPRACANLYPINAYAPPGWYAILVAGVTALEAIPGAELVQVKTKWGRPCVYVQGPPEAHDRAALIERALWATCMTCGAHLTGSVREVRRRYEPFGCTGCVDQVLVPA